LNKEIFLNNLKKTLKVNEEKETIIFIYAFGKNKNNVGFNIPNETAKKLNLNEGIYILKNLNNTEFLIKKVEFEPISSKPKKEVITSAIKND